MAGSKLLSRLHEDLGMVLCALDVAIRDATLSEIRAQTHILIAYFRRGRCGTAPPAGRGAEHRGQASADGRSARALPAMPRRSSVDLIGHVERAGARHGLCLGAG